MGLKKLITKEGSHMFFYCVSTYKLIFRINSYTICISIKTRTQNGFIVCDQSLQLKLTKTYYHEGSNGWCKCGKVRVNLVDRNNHSYLSFS